MLPAHRAGDGVRRCPGSGQRVLIDLSFPQWRARLDVAVREAALRRAVPVQRKAVPPVPPPVFRMAGAS
jgi:hypothetical protein